MMSGSSLFTASMYLVEQWLGLLTATTQTRPGQNRTDHRRRYMSLTKTRAKSVQWV